MTINQANDFQSISSSVPKKEFSDGLGGVRRNRKVVEGNAIIEDVAKKNAIPYIDLHSCYYDGKTLKAGLSDDGLHLKREAYSVWIDTIKSIIDKHYSETQQ